MRQIVESLWRLYNEKHSITKEKVLSMKISEEEKAYILGSGKKESIKKEDTLNLPS